MTDHKLAQKRCAACGNAKPVSEMKICMHNQMHRYVCDSKCMNDFYNPPKNLRHDAAAPAVQGEPVALPPFATKIIEKLRRFDECAEDGQDVDIGRHWLDMLVQLGLLHRVQRSPALWEMAQQGEDVLEGYAAPQPAEQQPAPDVPGLTEALRQYQHNDGSGLVFGYDKLLVDQYVAGLVEALEQGFPLLSDEGLDEVEHHCEWVIQRERKRVHSILAAYRKGGEA